VINSGKAYYNDVGKTATSFVYAQMEKVCNSIATSRHAVLTRDTIRSDNLIFSSLRNPYQYYVSIFNYEARPGKTGPLTKQFLSQEQNCDTFSNFMQNIFKKNLHWLPKEEPTIRNRPEGIGLLTFRYLAWTDTTFFMTSKRTMEDVKRWYDDHYFNDGCPFEFIGQNDMSNDFCDLVIKYQDKFSLKENWMNQIDHIRQHTKWDNPSDTGKGYKVFDHDFPSFYNDEIKDCVKRGDHILLDRYGFTC